MRLPKPVKTTVSLGKYRQRLRNQRHMKRIGSGAFATVFGRNGFNRVIKVGDGDDNYLRYVSLIGKKTANPYFPRIYSVKRYKTKSRFGISDDYYVVVMEKLISSFNVPDEKFLQSIKKFGCTHSDDLNSPRILKSSSRWEREAIKTLRKVWSMPNASRDIHIENVMFRKVEKDYQLVFTDPVA